MDVVEAWVSTYAKLRRPSWCRRIDHEFPGSSEEAVIVRSFLSVEAVGRVGLQAGRFQESNAWASWRFNRDCFEVGYVS